MFRKIDLVIMSLLFSVACGSGGDTGNDSVTPANNLNLDITTSVFTENNVGNAISLITDSSNNPIICHKSNGSSGEIKLEMKNTVWNSQTVITESSTGRTSSAIDSSDKMHIVYSSESSAYYITNKSGSWVSSNFDSDGLINKSFASVCIDDADKLHVSYYDITNSSLKYATNATGLWVSTTIDSSDDSGKYSIIRIDSNDYIHIVYLCTTSGAIKYITNENGTWQDEIVAGSVGSNYTIFQERYYSFDLDSSNNVHICFFDYSNDDLKYVTNKDGVWNIQIIDSTGWVGRYNKLVVDSKDKVHICYYNQTSGYLKYATNKNGLWQFAVIDDPLESNSNIGFGNDMVIDSDDNIHIAYRHYFEVGGSSFRNLKYANICF